MPGRESPGARTLASGSRIASPIQVYLEQLHARYAGMRDGQVATYIPELGKADPTWFGICVATPDGRVYEVGDTRQQFTIQSISKPFTYGLALEDRGHEAVLGRIGVEPSGEAFNSISLTPAGCPLNPMINAGAIATTSLIAGHSPDDRLERLLAVFSLYAGHPLSLDEAVYRSERDTGHRNRAIGHLLRNFDVLTDEPDLALDLYFKQCSILVDCRDVSIMAATLANGGRNPLTAERAVPHELVESILSVMTTCGMYDYAGEWLYSVGMPAKSGVGGGILAVLPGQLGVGVFSPALDSHGNSVRGVAVCRDLSRDFNLHFLRVPRTGRSSIRAQYGLAEMSSRRVRGERERAILDAVGNEARVYGLQGDLGFSAAELVVRKIVDASAELDSAVVDFTRAARVEPGVAAMFLSLVVNLGEQGKQLVLVGMQEHSTFLRSLEEGLTAIEQWGRLQTFADLDPALEFCEDRLLARHGVDADGGAVTLFDHQVCRGLGPDALARLAAVLQPRHYEPGALIVRKGDRADELFLLMAGQVSVTTALPDGQVKRLSTSSAGMAFGELAVLDRSERTADVRADKRVECLVLSAEDFDRLGAEQPAIKMRILENLLRSVHRMVGRLNRELGALAR
jgi:glutaminase